jgi:hypothetical protein
MPEPQECDHANRLRARTLRERDRVYRPRLKPDQGSIGAVHIAARNHNCSACQPTECADEQLGVLLGHRPHLNYDFGRRIERLSRQVLEVVMKTAYARRKFDLVLAAVKRRSLHGRDRAAAKPRTAL